MLKKTVWIVALGMMFSGCTPLTSEQKAEYDLMKQENVLVEKKDPTTGAVLGILPGFGAFYAREPVVGVIDLLLWPASILWDPVVGYEMSKSVNYDLTMAEMDRKKEKELSQLENDRDLGRIDDANYVVQKREIEQRYDFKRDNG